MEVTISKTFDIVDFVCDTGILDEWQNDKFCYLPLTEVKFEVTGDFDGESFFDPHGDEETMKMIGEHVESMEITSDQKVLVMYEIERMVEKWIFSDEGQGMAYREYQELLAGILENERAER